MKHQPDNDKLSDDSFGRWEVIDYMDLDTLVGMVVTHQKASTVAADKELFKYIGDAAKEMRILDFGSGVGRNAFELALHSKNWRIDCYDNEHMHKKANQLCRLKYKKECDEFSNIKFKTDWEEIKYNKYDCAIAVLVLQHIKERDLNVYLRDIKKMTKTFVVGGRRVLDEWHWYGRRKNVWRILEKNGYYPAFCTNKKAYEGGGAEDHFTCVYTFN